METCPHPVESRPPAPESPSQAEPAGTGRPARRRRTPPEIREALLDEFDALGVSARQFARRRDLCYQTLLSWLRTRREARGAGADRPGGFAEIVLEPGGAQPGGGLLRILLPGGASLEVRHRNELPAAAELLSLLEKC
jgi:hypothetical protein